MGLNVLLTKLFFVTNVIFDLVKGGLEGYMNLLLHINICI